MPFALRAALAFQRQEQNEAKNATCSLPPTTVGFGSKPSAPDGIKCPARTEDKICSFDGSVQIDDVDARNTGYLYCRRVVSKQSYGGGKPDLQRAHTDPPLPTCMHCRPLPHRCTAFHLSYLQPHVTLFGGYRPDHH